MNTNRITQPGNTKARPIHWAGGHDALGTLAKEVRADVVPGLPAGCCKKPAPDDSGPGIPSGTRIATGKSGRRRHTEWRRRVRQKPPRGPALLGWQGARSCGLLHFVVTIAALVVGRLVAMTSEHRPIDVWSKVFAAHRTVCRPLQGRTVFGRRHQIRVRTVQPCVNVRLLQIASDTAADGLRRGGLSAQDLDGFLEVFDAHDSTI